jgi:hypothetical protein
MAILHGCALSAVDNQISRTAKEGRSIAYPFAAGFISRLTAVFSSASSLSAWPKRSANSTSTTRTSCARSRHRSSVLSCTPTLSALCNKVSGFCPLISSAWGMASLAKSSRPQGAEEDWWRVASEDGPDHERIDPRGMAHPPAVPRCPRSPKSNDHGSQDKHFAS